MVYGGYWRFIKIYGLKSIKVEGNANRFRVKEVFDNLKWLRCAR